MARKIYRIDEFMGLDQSMGENGMAASYSPDACNMDTADGELTVAKGYTRYITSAVPGTEAIRRMFLFHSGSGDQVIVVTAAYTPTGKASGCSYTPLPGDSPAEGWILPRPG